MTVKSEVRIRLAKEESLEHRAEKQEYFVRINEMIVGFLCVISFLLYDRES